MNAFTIFGGRQSYYTNPQTNERQRGIFLSKSIQGYYHADYHGGNQEQRNTIGTVEYIITTLKNQFKDKSEDVLILAEKDLVAILNQDLPQVLRNTGKGEFMVCVIPRSKVEKNYLPTQLVFKKAIKGCITKLNGFMDGTDYVFRHTDTRTTHLNKSGYGGNGNLPYPGITKETCKLSEKITGKDVLLIDDLYTEDVNIDEDAIQALLDKGANSVVFYSLGKTIKKII